MADLDVYSFKRLIMLVGTIPITGYDEGDDVISIDRRVDEFDMKIGADANGVSEQSADQSGEIIFRLQSTSKSQKFMAAQFQLQSQGLLRSMPFVLKDPNNLVQVVTATHCIIKRPAPQVYGTAVGNREWQLIAQNLVII